MAEGIGIVSMDRITNIGAFAQALEPRRLGVRLAGLCDAAEDPYVTHPAPSAARQPTDPGRSGGARPFFACEADLEDELIRV